MEFLKKDSYLFGVIVGIVLPLILFGIMFLVDMQFNVIFEKHLVNKPDDLYLLSVTANLFSLRYFFTKHKLEKTGSGVLIATILIVLLYFYNFYQA